MTIDISRIVAAAPGDSDAPALLALFDVDIPEVATLRNCKLLESRGGICFVLAPDGLKFRTSATALRRDITDAALEAFEALED